MVAILAGDLDLVVGGVEIEGQAWARVDVEYLCTKPYCAAVSKSDSPQSSAPSSSR